MQAFHQVMEFDGLWLDMNEVSNYCTGDVCEVPGEPPCLACCSAADFALVEFALCLSLQSAFITLDSGLHPCLAHALEFRGLKSLRLWTAGEPVQPHCSL